MSKIRSYIAKLNVEDLAIPSNIVYGTAMAKRGGVEITLEEDDRVEARAGGLDGGAKEGGGSKRRVHFWLEEDELKTHCNGNPKNHDIFCKHCVAVLCYLIK